ncbi:MAG: aminotransferase class III-fold pyridoxal phosphate-dependent enzyme [Chloroflexota bacterium]|nr:aminotransferase class III-fold pyridoxal phosphate-dependent enzyme [Chloroflexota bacterium]
MVLAKGIANGFPVGVTITTDEIAAAWTRKTISTFGGNPVCMAAAEATLDVMVREDVPTRSRQRGAQLRSGLDQFYSRYEWIGDIRGVGLMQAMELVEDPRSKQPSRRLAAALLEAAKRERLLIGLAGASSNVARIAPSMLVSEEEVEEALDRLERALNRVNRVA